MQLVAASSAAPTAPRVSTRDRWLLEADAMMDRDRIDLALARLEGAQKSDKRNPLVHCLLARLMLLTGHVDQALALIGKVEQMPGGDAQAVRVLVLRGNVLRRQGQAAAARAFTRSALAHPDCTGSLRAASLANIAELDLEAGDDESALRAIMESLEINPESAYSWRLAGVVQDATGDPNLALVSFKRSLEIQASVPALANMGKVFLRLGQPEAAEKAYRTALKLDPLAAPIWINLGIVLNNPDRREEAAEAFAAALRAEPGHPIASHMLAAIRGELSAGRAADDYVKGTFDAFAREFDEKLEQLQYRAPALVAAAISKATGAASDLRVLDAGCGTGLCAPLLKPFARRLDGVDLSPRMLAKAAERGLYDSLAEAELTGFLAGRPASYDLIAAADVVVYFGDLAPLFAAASAALTDRGLFVFTVERGDGVDYVLCPHGRYAHSENAIRRLAEAAGFTVESLEEAQVRVEGGHPVTGLVIVLQNRRAG